MDERIDTRTAVGRGVRVFTWIAAVALLVAVALPSFMPRRSTATHYACVNNLRQIDSGKEQAALANGWAESTDGDSPTNATLINCYIKGNTFPECPDGGKYSYGRMDQNPTCSLYDPEHPKLRYHRLKDGATR